MNVCDGLLHSVSEKEEVEFLLHLSAVLRKQPATSLLFFSDVGCYFNVLIIFFEIRDFLIILFS